MRNSPVSSLILTRPSVRLRMSCSARSTVKVEVGVDMTVIVCAEIQDEWSWW